jgi:hypothetical protein
MHWRRGQAWQIGVAGCCGAPVHAELRCAEGHPVTVSGIGIRRQGIEEQPELVEISELTVVLAQIPD